MRRNRRNPGNLKRTKNPTAWKEEEGGRGRRNLQHGSPKSKEEQVSKEGEEEPYGIEVLPQRRSR